MERVRGVGRDSPWPRCLLPAPLPSPSYLAPEKTGKTFPNPFIRSAKLASPRSPPWLCRRTREKMRANNVFQPSPLRRSSAIFRKPLTSAEEHEPGWGKTRSKKYFPRVMPIKGDARLTTMTLGCSLLTLKIRLSGEEKREIWMNSAKCIYTCVDDTWPGCSIRKIERDWKLAVEYGIFSTVNFEG